MSVKCKIVGIRGMASQISLDEEVGMEKTQTIEKETDEYDWMLVSYGKKRFEEEKKQCREEGERNGFVKGEVEKSESIARNMLKYNYPPDEISRLTELDLARILQLAEANNL